MITKRQFDIVVYVSENPEFDINVMALDLCLDSEEIHANLIELERVGLINNGSLTSDALALLDKHKVDNAIILAAGMSTRFAPMNYEIPKGLLEVKGERLIERQILQLREKGIFEIVVVVGFMKEKFAYLTEKYGVILVESPDYLTKNNFSSVYAARKYLKNTIVTSSDLYFVNNLFQKFAYDSYYCTVYIPGKTAERGIITDDDDKIIDTMYGDRCVDVWVTLGYAFFSKAFSDAYIKIVEQVYDLPKYANKFWADIQDENLDKLYMYAKHCQIGDIKEFDSLEELREFDDKYLYNSGSKILKKICYRLAVNENNIIGIESLKKLRDSMFGFRCKGDMYICDVNPDDRERISYNGRVYYSCRDVSEGEIKLFKMDKNVYIKKNPIMDAKKDIDELNTLSKEFIKYHREALPLCAAENVISDFANFPLGAGFQERYIMNNTYSFNMDDNFIGCERLFPFYQKLSELCERVFGARYSDPRPFTGMHCIDMITKTVCKPGDKMMILGKEYGGHASVKPVVERLGIQVFEAPYNLDEYDLDYTELNRRIIDEDIKYVLLAPSDLIKPLDVEKINTEKCVLLWDCSQLMGLIIAGLCPNPLKSKKNMIMFGGTHKTFPGPASGLILTNDKYLHDLMEKNINPKFLRHSQMHQKISLLFALLEFERYGVDYMSHMIHCSNYLGQKLKEKGFDIADYHGQISLTHQIFIRCTKEEMDTIYDNAYRAKVTLNKKHKALFLGYGIRLGTQEIARYDWNDEALDIIADVVYELSLQDFDLEKVQRMISTLPDKEIKYAFPGDIVDSFYNILDK